MTVYQHYYTAWFNSARGAYGQQTKAQSEPFPIATESDAVWIAMKDYALPSGMSDRDVEHHPQALRYMPAGTNLVWMMHYQSTGADVARSDSSARFGNLFVHTLLLAPQDFVAGDPIQYWDSPFWKAEDPEPNYHLLDVMPTFSAPPQLAYDQAVAFIKGQSAGWAKLTALLSAVTNNAQSPRPVLIIDEPDVVAKWIAAVTLLLPKAHRRLLTFSTYCHAYPSPYMITGLHPQQSSQLSRQDMIDYFVLDGAAGRISDVVASRYGSFAVNCLKDGVYESALAPLFQIASQRFSAPDRIDRNLETLLDIGSLFDPARVSAFSHQEVKSLQNLVDAEAVSSAVSAGDLEYLHQLHLVCLHAVTKKLVTIPSEQYKSIVWSVARRDPNWPERLAEDLCQAVEFIVRGDLEQGREIATCLRQVCAQPELAASLARQQRWHNELLARASVPILPRSHLWETLGLFMIPEETPSKWIAQTVKAAFQPADGAHEAEQRRLRQIVERTIAPQAVRWAMLIRKVKGQVEDSYLRQFYYYCLVTALWPPKERDAIWNQVGDALPDVATDELYRDLEHRTDLAGNDAKAVLDLWIKVAERRPVKWKDLLSTVQTWPPSAKRHAVSVALLVKVPMDDQSMVDFAAPMADQIIREIKIDSKSRDEDDVCQRWGDSQGISPEARKISQAINSVRAGNPPPGAVALITGKLFGLGGEPKQYREICSKYLSAHFPTKGDTSSHAADIRVVYKQERADIFWDEYWKQFDKVLFGVSSGQALEPLLTFWFQDSPAALADTPYVVPEFFIRFGAHLDGCAGTRKRELTAIHDRLKKRSEQHAWTQNVLALIAASINKAKFLGML